jgi:hypothetical protein
MRICDWCGEEVFGDGGKVYSPEMDDGEVIEDDICPDCYFGLLHNEVNDPGCKSWCNSRSDHPHMNEDRVAYCNCKTLETPK